MKHFVVVLSFIAGFLACSAWLQSADEKAAEWDKQHGRCYVCHRSLDLP
jgi:hypothetical protein